MSVSSGPLRRTIARQRRWVHPLLLLAPALGILLAVVVVPLVSSFRRALTNFNLSIPITDNVGLENYARALTDTRFRESLETTIIFSVGSTCLSLVIGYVAAQLLTRSFRGRRLMTLVLIAPMMITPIVVGVVWLLMFQPDFSVINGLLAKLGINGPIWLQSPKTALLAIIIADTWQWTPLFILVLLAGLLGIPPELKQAAEVDGASPFQQFRYVTLPLMKPLILVTVLIRFIDAFKSFDAVFVMTNGGPGNATEVLSLHIWRAGIPFLDLGYASAMSYLFLVILTIFTTILIRILARRT